MSVTVNVAEAKAQLSKLLDRAVAGEEVVIARAGKPMARLVPVAGQGRRPLGLLAHWAPYLDALTAPLPPDVQAAVEGEDSDEYGITKGVLPKP
ncbi:MAG: type II toxin-antitoxin system Phd/YefM family antitoxin [Alphaproteobacteria bacterium]|nr:type II toxin-antitoxin system Phd/YefM family antitoxin [Alphaproteobacteria bacterium]